MKNLLIRSLSGLILVWVMIEAVASENGWYYVLWTVVGVLSLWELFSLAAKHLAKGKGRQGVRTMMVTDIVGGLYILLAITLLMTMQQDWIYVIVLLTLVWSNDVGAYLVGSAIGRHPMARSISPKKSWEGFVGGLLFAITVALVWWGLYFNPLTTPVDGTILSKIVWAGLGVTAAVGAVAGDLVESKFKRWIGVKDSGKIIPGHGGMLDRFDALFFAVPIVWLYLKFIISLWP